MTKPWLGLFIAVGFGLVLSASGCADMPRQEDASQRSDYETSLEELQSRAEQEDAEAQVNLGVMYAVGQGVPQDYQEAMKWFRLAADQGLEKAAKWLEVLEKEMTPAQLAEAQRLAREWKAKEQSVN